MAYMRNEKCIDINGSVQKRKLRYIGYFHGYKGYRYFYNLRKMILLHLRFSYEFE